MEHTSSNNHQILSILIQRANTSTAKLALPLEVDMLLWLDEIKYKNTFGTSILAEWVIANTNSVTIMAYRDSAPMIIDIVKNEMTMAQNYGKRIVVGEKPALSTKAHLQKNAKPS